MSAWWKNSWLNTFDIVNLHSNVPNSTTFYYSSLRTCGIHIAKYHDVLLLLFNSQPPHMQAVLADIISAILHKDLHDTIVTSFRLFWFTVFQSVATVCIPIGND